MTLPGRNFFRSEANASNRRCSASQISKKSARPRIVAASSSCIPPYSRTASHMPGASAPGCAAALDIEHFLPLSGIPFAASVHAAKVMHRLSPDPGALRHQSIAAVLGNQQPRVGGIAFDLLAQPVDMGFERMRGDPIIVAPHFLE